MAASDAVLQRVTADQLIHLCSRLIQIPSFKTE